MGESWQPPFTRHDLRDEVCKELKALRKVLEVKEDKTLPKPMLAAVMKILWDK